jgi:hypothetical protein
MPRAMIVTVTSNIVLLMAMSRDSSSRRAELLCCSGHKCVSVGANVSYLHAPRTRTKRVCSMRRIVIYTETRLFRLHLLTSDGEMFRTASSLIRPFLHKMRGNHELT